VAIGGSAIEDPAELSAEELERSTSDLGEMLKDGERKVECSKPEDEVISVGTGVLEGG